MGSYVKIDLKLTNLSIGHETRCQQLTHSHSSAVFIRRRPPCFPHHNYSEPSAPIPFWRLIARGILAQHDRDWLVTERDGRGPTCRWGNWKLQIKTRVAFQEGRRRSDGEYIRTTDLHTTNLFQGSPFLLRDGRDQAAVIVGFLALQIISHKQKTK